MGVCLTTLLSLIFFILFNSGVYQNFGHFLVKWCAMSSTSDNGNFPKPGSSDVQGKAIEKKSSFNSLASFYSKKDLCGACHHLSMTRIFPGESGDSEVDNPDVS